MAILKKEPPLELCIPEDVRATELLDTFKEYYPKSVFSTERENPHEALGFLRCMALLYPEARPTISKHIKSLESQIIKSIREGENTLC